MSIPLKKLDRLLKNEKGFPKEFRFYYLLDDKHYYISNGELQNGFEKLNITNIELGRDELLSIYSKMEFIFDELIRLLIIGFRHDEKSKKLLYILSIVPVNRKIRLFLDWKIFGKEFTQKLSRLFEVKNDALHCVLLSEITYRKSKLLSLAKKKDLNEFKEDLEKAYDELIMIYKNQLKDIAIDKMSKEIKAFQTKRRKIKK